MPVQAPPLASGSATPCCAADPVTGIVSCQSISATEDENKCEVCAPLPSDCGVTTSAIPFSSIPPGTTTLNLVITNSFGAVQSTCITVPDQDPATLVCLGDCITFLCNSTTSDCATSTYCVFSPTGPAVLPLNPPYNDNPCDNFHLLALLIGNTAAVEFFHGFHPCPVIDSPASNLGILNVSCVDGKPATTVQLSADELALVMEYGLNYRILLSSACCDCLTVQNSFRLVSGDAQCGTGVPPTSCSPPVTVSDTTDNVYNTIQLPACCILPACTPGQGPTVVSVTPIGALPGIPTDFSVQGSNFDCSLAIAPADFNSTINSFTLVSTTDLIVNATLTGTVGSTASIEMQTSCGSVTFQLAIQ